MRGCLYKTAGGCKRDLTFNFGLRWDYIMPFWEKYNHIQTIIPGRQSVLYPDAPSGLGGSRRSGHPEYDLAFENAQLRPATRSRLCAAVRSAEF